MRIVTDGFDNLQQKIAPDLQGVVISIVMLQVESAVARSLATREVWKEYFRAHGAVEVNIYPAEGKPR
ncbi:MAG: hypothetical protein ABS52_07765 [Gemmatimonadetes bacterium SCN 70-22]|nr:MAG: hypothetical protein ABS52_07765 [Gemmatimonadetes bacterium SCN 70-22]